MDGDAAILAARERLAARFANAGAQVGGKGTVRRKHKAAHKAAGADDKKLQATLKRLGVNPLPAIEEVNMFKEDGNIIHFENPRVQASVQYNTYAVSGNAETKTLQELLPGILGQMGKDNLQMLKKLAEAYTRKAGEGGVPGDDEDMPELVGNFDEASK